VDGKRQKNQMKLAFMAEEWGETSSAVSEGTEPSERSGKPKARYSTSS